MARRHVALLAQLLGVSVARAASAAEVAPSSEVCGAQDGGAPGTCDTGGSTSCGCGALRRRDFDIVAKGEASGSARQPDAGGQAEGAGETEAEAAVIFLDGGRFTMGLAAVDEGDSSISPVDAEGPAREVAVGAFGLGAHEVSNRRFARFVERTGYVTESERFGWSFAVEAFVSPEVNATITRQVHAAPWWLPVERADWRHPNGPDTSIEEAMDHPVTQVSLGDAQAFCRWSRPGGRLPTEAEWEFAARGGKSGRRFPWGQSVLTGAAKSTYRMNFWQSDLDEKLVRKDGSVFNLYGFGDRSLAAVKEYYGARNLALDGYKATAPVDAYGPQNALGFHNMVGNVWEWTSTPWESADPSFPSFGENAMVKKGGSFLCNPATCNRFRISARMAFTADSAASNVGFRCAYDPTPAPAAVID
mmetsp:Transcript_73816/g.204499  ORF Transcript_73816/g.204499 Transcript_73816/m.204499 type:complete len:418 (+) Transcript_73816:63-1316(+)